MKINDERMDVLPVWLLPLLFHRGALLAERAQLHINFKDTRKQTAKAHSWCFSEAADQEVRAWEDYVLSVLRVNINMKINFVYTQPIIRNQS